MAELQSGQNVTATGTPPISSLTISCRVRIWSGYALATPSTSSAMTGSRGASHSLTAATGSKRGLSIGGMPSRPTPPEKISV